MSVTSETGAKPYGKAAAEYIEQIRQQSPPAADCLEHIQAQYGTRAVYLAAFALVFLKQRETEHSYATSAHDLHAFTYCEEMRNDALALQLYETAAAHFLRASPDDKPLTQ
jgi:hypothetical protein